MPLVETELGLRFEEHLHDGAGYFICVKRVLRDVSGLQRVLLFESERHGLVLAIDESIQLTERDEHIYHEAIVHVPLLAHPDPRDVLIIGGGDGGAASRALLHPTVERLIQVEIDPNVVNVSREFLGSVHGNCFDDPRMKLILGDGLEYLSTQLSSFDVIIVDGSDPGPDGTPSNVLMSSEFLTKVALTLRPRGIYVSQCGMPSLQAEQVRRHVQNVSAVFGAASLYLVDVPMYGGGNIAISIAGKYNADCHPMQCDSIDLKNRMHQRGLQCRYYTPDIHGAMFTLPAALSNTCACTESNT